jgi:hypothetical protein
VRIQRHAASQHDRDRIGAAVSRIRGSIIRSVRYLLPPPLGGEIWSYPGFDVVPGAILLDAQPEKIYVVWRIDEVRGDGLQVILGDEYHEDARDEGLHDGGTNLDRRFAALVEQSITSVGIAWQGSGWDNEAGEPNETLWALRLSAQDHCITFALGSVSDEPVQPTYQPDAVLAIFDRTIAQEYRSPTARSAASGIDV